MQITLVSRLSPEDLGRYRMAILRRMCAEDAQSIANPLTREEYEQAIMKMWNLIAEIAPQYDWDTNRDYRVNMSTGDIWYVD